MSLFNFAREKGASFAVMNINQQSSIPEPIRDLLTRNLEGFDMKYISSLKGKATWIVQGRVLGVNEFGEQGSPSYRVKLRVLVNSEQSEYEDFKRFMAPAIRAHLEAFQVGNIFRAGRIEFATVNGEEGMVIDFGIPKGHATSAALSMLGVILNTVQQFAVSASVYEIAATAKDPQRVGISFGVSSIGNVFLN